MVTDFYGHVVRLLAEALRHATMIKDIRYKGHVFLLPSGYYVISQYEYLTYGAHDNDGRCLISTVSPTPYVHRHPYAIVGQS